jgi:hypothetical protein
VPVPEGNCRPVTVQVHILCRPAADTAYRRFVNRAAASGSARMIPSPASSPAINVLKM